jgi:hypothetical protein
MEQDVAPQPSLELVARTPDRGLLVELGPQRRKEIKRLKRGEGPLTRRILAAVEQQCEEFGIDPAAEIVPVVLLYRQDKPDYVVIIPTTSHTPKGSRG